MERSLRNKIVEFLSSIVLLEKEDGRQSLIYSASLDKELQNQLIFDGARGPFCQLLISTLISYGKLQDGRDALEAIMGAAKEYVGIERKEYCEILIQEWQASRRETTSREGIGQKAQRKSSRQHQIDDGESPDYRYDVFLSYKDDFIGPWVDRYFFQLFKFHLNGELGREPEIFSARHDSSAGDIWPLRLKIALAHSRCLVAIWSPSYFKSLWSRRECAMMLYREKQARSVVRDMGRLILPVVVSDGKHFPEFAKNISWFNCHDFAIPTEAFGKSERYITFRDKMEEWVENVGEAIKRAPLWCEEWLHDPVIKIPETPALIFDELPGLE